MIERIRLHNFQSHRRTALDFSRGLNVIIGTSDRGKTAILRALRLVVFNQPAGDSYRSHGTNSTEVEVIVDPWASVTRAKGKRGNVYRLEFPEREAEELKAVGKGAPPDEVARELNMDALNFHSQLDPPFLILNTPGEVASTLNRVADLSIIDSSLAWIGSEGRTVRQRAEQLEATVTELSDRVRAAAWVDEAAAEVDVAGAQAKDIRAKQERASVLLRLLQRATTARDTVRGLAWMDAAKSDLGAVEGVQKALSDAMGRAQGLRNAVRRSQDAQDAVEGANLYNPLSSALIAVRERYTALQGVSATAKGLREALDRLQNVTKRNARAGAELTSAQEQYRAVAPVGAECPLCDGKGTL